jgi:acyl-CoA synthetase (NDP forming)
MNREEFQALDLIFHPRSVAVVGVSGRPDNPNRFFLDSLRSLGFRGPIYAINKRSEQVDDFPTFSSLQDVPDPIDHVIVAVPADNVMDVLDQCHRKGVKAVSVFSSGFSESDDAKGKELERELSLWMKGKTFRLLGPNCMGIYCPSSGIGYRADFPREPGPIGFISQSGGMTITGVIGAAKRGLRFSKVISYGNEVDISSHELLYYLAMDPSTELVWAYVEGTKNGRELFKAMKEVSRTKPLVVLKGGLTPSGVMAAASHTGSMAGESIIWEAALKEAGAVQVKSPESLVDTTQALLWLPPCRGRRLGLICISGGLSVNFTDLAVKGGFEVPRLSPSVVETLKSSMDLPGTSMNNPLDMAAGFFFFPQHARIFKILEESGELDLLVLVLAAEYFFHAVWELGGMKISRMLLDAFVQAASQISIPLVVVVTQVGDEDIRKSFEEGFLKIKTPVFPTMERAVDALQNWASHWEAKKRTTAGSMY